MGIKEARFSGQMTVEFVVAFPAMMAIALIAVNAVLFFSDCASFDRLFRNSVCAYAASPAYEQGGRAKLLIGRNSAQRWDGEG